MEKEDANLNEDTTVETDAFAETEYSDSEADASGKKELTKGQKFRNTLVELLIYAVIIVVCIVFVPKYVIQRTIVDGTSMESTLQDEDNLLVEKVSYHLSKPDRFDVIVFYPFGKENDAYYIKRVIGLPGETIQIVGDTIYINGEVLEENYGKDPMTKAGIAKEPLTLGEDEYFVLGDNRAVSEDSRYPEIGPVTRDKIAGKAVLRIYPFSKFGIFR